MNTTACLESDAAPTPSVSTESKSWGQLMPIIGNRLVGLGLRLAGLAAILWVTLIFFVAVSLVLPTCDFGRFYHSAVAFWQGQGMYQWNPTVPLFLPGEITLDGEDVIIDLLNLNPPHFHLLFLPLALFPIEMAFALWTVAGILSCGLSAKWAMRELNASWSLRVGQIALVLFFGSIGNAIVVHIGQIGWVLVLPITLMWLAARHEQWLKCGVWLGILAATKPFFLIFLPYFVLKRNWRAVGGTLLGAGGLFAVGVLVFGWENYQGWFASLRGVDGWSWMHINGSLWGTLSRAFMDNPLYEEVIVLDPKLLKLIWLVLGGIMGVLTLAVACFDKSREHIDRSFALLLVASVALSPLGWVYYYCLPVVPLAALLLTWHRQQQAGLASDSWSRRRWWLLAAAIPGLVWCVHWTRWFQPSPLATLTLGNFFFATIFITWLMLILDGWRHVEFPRFAKAIFSTKPNLMPQRT